MWSYYGSKTLQAPHYPKPQYDKIIEPFAGAAKYSLLHWERDITLIDKYEIIVRIWKWLQQCSAQDILKFPKNMPVGSRVRDLKFDLEEQYWFYGFIVAKAAERPRNNVPNRVSVDRPNHITYQLKKIASNLHKIRHWEIIHGSYEEVENKEVTWFIDPPYQFGGKSYPMNKIDYSNLAKWCTNRVGQVIVCENSKADWLPFKRMMVTNGNKGRTTEVIWSNFPTVFDNEQIKLQL